MIITHSSLQCFQACRRKYKLRYMDCIVPKIKSQALGFGSAMHTALEEYFKYVDASQKFVESDGKCDFTFDCDKVLSDKVESAKLAGLIAGYVRKWYSEDFDKYNVIAIEKEFKCDMPKSCAYIAGKIDGVVQDNCTGKYYILEHKTASIVDEAYVSQKDIDSQTLLYAVALKYTMGIVVDGVIHDIIIKQKIRPKKGESEEDFCARLIEDVTDDNFIRVQVDLTPEQIKDFEAELEQETEDLAWCKSFYKCTGSCLGKYGACEYLPICRAGGLVDSLKDKYEIARAHEELSETTVGE